MGGEETHQLAADITGGAKDRNANHAAHMQYAYLCKICDRTFVRGGRLARADRLVDVVPGASATPIRRLGRVAGLANSRTSTAVAASQRLGDPSKPKSLALPVGEDHRRCRRAGQPIAGIGRPRIARR